MKILHPFLPRLFLILHFSAISALAALSGSDNFNDNTKDTTKWGTDAITGGATLVEANSRLEYRVATPGGDFDEALRPWVLNTAGSGEAFDVVLDVFNNASPTGSNNVSIGLMVTSLENAQDKIYVEFGSGGPDTDADGKGFLAALSSAAAGGDEVLPYTMPTSHDSVTTASVRLSYNPSTKIFTAYYDPTGSADGFQWVAYGSFGVGASGGGDMRNSPWQLTQNLGFKIAVEAFSEGLVVSGGNVYADNFRTSLAALPAVSLAAPAALTTTTATLNGAVNPNGSTTTAQFEYGQTASYGSTAALTLSPAAGTTSQNVSLPISGLQPGTLYHYRLSATNSSGTASTSDTTFTTLTAQQAWRQVHFGTSDNAGNAADAHDFDKDGIPNLIEYAMNLDPTATSKLPATHRHTGATFEYTYTRSVAALNAGTAFTVEWSDTLPGPVPWSTTGVTEQILSSNGTVQQVKATIPTGGSAGRFVRLKITGPGN